MTPFRLPPIERWSLAALLANDATIGTWAVACAPIESLGATAEDLREQMGSLFDIPVTIVQVTAAPEVVGAVATRADEALIVLGLQHWDEHEWYRLDLVRSRLVSKHPILLLLDKESLIRFAAHAPNLWSWVGGSAWTVGESSSEVK